MLNIGLADAGISAWDAKYTYNFWRPVTAIRNASTDGNSQTSADSTWTPLINTPPFPEYVSGHSTFSGVASTVLTSFFGENYSFTTTSVGLPNVSRSFTSFAAAADEAGMSRIYGGIHFYTSDIDGLVLGEKIGTYVVNNLLKPTTQTGRIQAGLANDTAALGTTNRDGITKDATITGQVTGQGQLWAKFGAGSLVDISTSLNAQGQFTLSSTKLAQIYGGTLTQGQHNLILQLVSAQGILLDSVQVTFTLDTVGPSTALTSPVDNSAHSATARLIGHFSDANLSTTARYSLDGQAFSDLTVDAQGKFSQLMQAGLAAGHHQLTLEGYDAAGNLTQTQLDFAIANGLQAAGTGTEGWAMLSGNTLTLAEQNSLLVQALIPVALGVTTGTRKLSFDLTTFFDTSDLNGISPDRLLVYLVDANNPSQTLLDGGEPRTALFSLAGNKAEYQAGRVSYNGTHVEIDLSSLAATTQGRLVVQLLNTDGDTGTQIKLSNLTNQVDPNGVSSPVLPTSISRVNPGTALNLDSLQSTTQVQVQLSNVRLDAATGRYVADLAVRNTGTTALSRQMAVLLTQLPTGVTLVNASGTHAAGSPYLNLTGAIGDGDLAPGAVSGKVQVVLENPNQQQFDLQAVVLVGALNQPPQLESLGSLNVVAGGRLEVPLTAIDPEGTPVTLSLRSADNLPTGKLVGNKLVFAPSPTEVGTYHFTLVATSGNQETTQDVTLNVTADPVKTTRISGVIQDTNQAGLGGIIVEVDGWQSTTAVNGSFTIELPTLPPNNTLKVFGNLVNSTIVSGHVLDRTITYPFIAEKLPLLLEHEVYAGVDNAIARPIYLPVIDVASGKTIDPSQTVEVTTAAIPEAKVTVEANSLKDQNGNPFRGILSITEVPTNLTPAALPENLYPDLVVTIQPGDMVFTTPAPLSLPNLSGYAAGKLMDLWSINPVTGQFDNVGTGQVSADGTRIDTIEGGVRNSSWHFFASPPEKASDPKTNPYNPMDGCNCCKKENEVGSTVELYSGALNETHSLVTYQSGGESRGLTLSYNSLRANPTPIVHFGYDNVDANAMAPGFTEYLRLIAKMTVSNGSFSYQVPGYSGSRTGLTGSHFWKLPTTAGKVDAALQADLSALPTGVYEYSLQTGINLLVPDGRQVGSSSTNTGKLVSVNSVDSIFGSGWGLSGLQELVKNGDGSLLLIDGDGSVLHFESAAGGTFTAPPGDFSKLEKLADGSYLRTTKDQTVYLFNAALKLVSMQTRTGDLTRYTYNNLGQLTRITDPTGLMTQFAYTGSQVSSITDSAGRVTRLVHDAVGNLTKVIDPDGTHRTWSYDAKHQMTGETDQQGYQEQEIYNAFGRVVKAIKKDGSVVQVDPVQSQGLYTAAQTSNLDNAPTAFQLSNQAIGSFVDGNGNVTRTRLDQAGQTMSEFDSVGTLPSSVRNGQNLVSLSVDGKGNQTEYAYDANGNVISVKDSTPGVPTTINTPLPNQVYATGNNPTSVVYGDLNHDGLQDIITLNNGNDEKLSVLLGQRGGGFSPKYAIPLTLDAATRITSIGLGDIDADGNLDLVLGTALRINTPPTDPNTASFALVGNGYGGDSQYEYNLLTLKGNGLGSMGAATSQTLEAEISGVMMLGDLDLDGQVDIVGSNNDLRKITLLQNNQGVFSSVANLGTDVYGTATLRDLNQDGKLDIISAGYGSQVSIFLSTGVGRFGYSSTQVAVDHNLNAIAIGDINKDGRLDIVTAGGSRTSVLYNRGNGNFATSASYLVGNTAYLVQLADLNKDGWLDVITAGSSTTPNVGKTSVLSYAGAERFSNNAKTYTTGQGLLSMILSEATADQTLDLVLVDATARAVLVLQGTGAGGFIEQTQNSNTFGLMGSPTSVVLADINQDGWLDAVSNSVINGGAIKSERSI
ncbi:MAG: VCBS repeat-containing protein [Aphanocapsa sp. GSE-SYN-MK-11-07L]|jgi:YD repeat-containing protein|nr:VCBS repeat-containing protein [Aphanocapsa sp. GSE-SYN-MK-11-07L]